MFQKESPFRGDSFCRGPWAEVLASERYGTDDGTDDQVRPAIGDVALAEAAEGYNGLAHGCEVRVDFDEDGCLLVHGSAPPRA